VINLKTAKAIGLTSPVAPAAGGPGDRVVDRRAFLATLIGSLLAAPLAAGAQQAGRVWRIGYLSADDPSAASHLVDAFRQGLRDLGYVEGRNVIIEFRFADGKYDRLPHLAAELVRDQVDVIMAFTIPAVRAAKTATTAIPIVFAQVLDPVGAGLVAKLARPGANVTGVSIMVEELSGKYLELLKEVVPRMSQVAVLWEPDQPAGALLLTHIERAARALRVQLQPLKVQNPNDFDNAFSAVTRLRADAFLVLPSSLFNLHRHRLADLAARSRVPAIFVRREFVDAGGLMSYAPDFADQSRRVATHVDKILKGAKPGDLPVQQPTKFELVINLKTAKALGLTIPQSLLQRADQVIE
jgi:putative ABC transport system substrate-binding protein